MLHAYLLFTLQMRSIRSKSFQDTSSIHRDDDTSVVDVKLRWDAFADQSRSLVETVDELNRKSQCRIGEKPNANQAGSESPVLVLLNGGQITWDQRLWRGFDNPRPVSAFQAVKLLNEVRPLASQSAGKPRLALGCPIRYLASI